MNWFSFAESGKSFSDISRKIKRVIRTDPFFIKLFKKYNVSMDKLDTLHFKIKKMEGLHAQSNYREIHLNSKLFEDGDFFKNKIHFVVHELVHWLIRQREKEKYFSDQEEHYAFISSMLYEITNGKNKIQIKNIFFPLIKDHFDTLKKSEMFFEYLFSKALSEYNE